MATDQIAEMVYQQGHIIAQLLTRVERLDHFVAHDLEAIVKASKECVDRLEELRKNFGHAKVIVT